MRESWCTVRGPAVIFILTIAILTTARLLYFGFPLPNTYYAKVSPDLAYNLRNGLIYLTAFIALNPIALILTIWAASAGIIFNLPKLLRNIRSAPEANLDAAEVHYFCVSIIAFTGLLVPVLTGGDHFNLLRFYQPIWPLLFLPIAAMFRNLKLPFSERIRNALGIAAIILVLFAPGSRWDSLSDNRISFEFELAESGAMLGNTLTEMFSGKLPSIAFPTVGGFAQGYKGDVVDIYGLNNVAIGHAGGNRYGWKNHAAFNREEFLKQQPDLFLPETGSFDYLVSTPTELLYNAFVNNIYYDPEFIRQYALALISDSETHVRTFVRRDLIDSLQEQGFEVLEIDYLEDATATQE
jgi:hypothetical protein